MLCHRQAIYKSKGNKLSSCAECRIWTRVFGTESPADWHTYIHTYLPTHLPTYIHTCIHTSIQTYAYYLYQLLLSTSTTCLVDMAWAVICHRKIYQMLSIWCEECNVNICCKRKMPAWKLVVITIYLDFTQIIGGRKSKCHIRVPMTKFGICIGSKYWVYK